MKYIRNTVLLKSNAPASEESGLLNSVNLFLCILLRH